MEMKHVRHFLFPLLVAAAFLGGYGYGRWYGKKTDGGAIKKGGRKVLYYIDPMHPSYKSDKPGIAPDCGMKLVPVYEGGQLGGEEPAPVAGGKKIAYYRDPQDPKYISDKPGLNPETGNELEPVYTDGASPAPPGTIYVSPEKQQLIGVRYGVAEITPVTYTIRAAGKVALDETRVARVHSRIDGWIDQVYVNFVGQQVQKGQNLLTIYSPEMVATQHELLLALKSRDLTQNSPLRSMWVTGDSLVTATKKRLELWELSEDQINEVVRTGKPITFITLHAPITGYVIARNAFPKQRITPETELYAVADFSRVWIIADVFEYEAPLVRLGQPARVSLSYIPTKPLSARVSYIQPQVDPVTRTLKIRLEANNPDLLLKPDMYADVELQVSVPPRLSVPAEAVLDSGLTKTVFVDRGNGYLEPRQVETGERLGNRIEIRKGLYAGERIVTSGNFLIDSESQLRAAAGGEAGQHDSGGKAHGSQQPAGHDRSVAPAAPLEHKGHQR